ncbi:helix-turn-helix domain-containing protein [Sphingobacterium sp. lm-10]|uniref:helix-turn-helix domain-containing protein n=1 Tax=Sphingobacterium sp. lm-10 TaxID=2944904 RepID=UPI0020218D50|nr:helix-turn-helix domain-containing protein [Sphingobacterium sp. lm-10]MCL7987052.1 helix-turn-helix domain-containing protein [Sphingobacterium sp. lm-10]
MSKKVSKDLPKEVKKIGLRLRQVRKELGFSNSDDFAYKYELNRSQYGKYEAGSEDLRISSLINILEKIDMSLNDFFNKDFDGL